MERNAVKMYLQMRQKTHNSPYYATLDPSSVADERTGKTLKRAGFDPFNDQDRWTTRYEKKKRSVPELHGEGRVYGTSSLRQNLALPWAGTDGGGYADLRYFPKELWSTLDPKRESHMWSTLPSPADTPKPKSKRKHDAIIGDTDTHMQDANDSDDDPAEATQASDSDDLVPSSRRLRTISKSAKKRRRERDKAGSSREKRGLDAEDEYGSTKKTGPSPPSTIAAREKKRKKQERKNSTRNTNTQQSVKEEHAAEAQSDSDDAGAGKDDDDVGSGSDDGSESGGGDSDSEPVDSEFEESDEGEGDDYNAEQYFEDGEDDGMDDFGEDGDEGGAY